MSDYELDKEVHVYERDTTRPHSMELSIQLENELMSPDPPSEMPVSSAQAGTSRERPQSLDTHVLASIVTQLRLSLAQVTKERDDLQTTLSETQALEAEMKASLQDLMQKCSTMQVALEEAAEKERESQDAIAMLRNKVEESRRGLMRLQTENRRQSTMTLDMSRAGVPSAGGPSSSRRASFTPLTGSGTPNAHRRFSSISNYTTPDYGDNYGHSPGAQTLTFPDSLQPPAISHPPLINHPPSSTRRLSGFFSRHSSSESSASLPSSSLLHPSSTALESLRQELNAVRTELEETRNELSEANEAREASDICAKALREFIAENGISDGHGGDSESVKLPPLPSTTTGEESDGRKAASWGISKLWRVDTSASTHSGTSASSTTSPSDSRRTPTTQNQTQNQNQNLSQTNAPTISQKLGGFWGSSRASISSVTSGGQPHNSYAASDTSSIVESVAEPISPAEQQGVAVNVNVVTRRDSGSSSPENIVTRNKAGMLRARLENNGVVPELADKPVPAIA